MADKRTLDCAVIGAGIAGLGAAIALRRGGHDVELFERSEFKKTVGAAIAMTPNANLILDAWGFDRAKASETPLLQQRALKPDALDVVVQRSFADVRRKYGQPFSSLHRVDFHDGLRELATGERVPGPVPKLHLRAEVVEIDCEAGLLTLKDGSKIRKDLIVVADGIKSRFIEPIVEFDVPIERTGKSVYRILMPMDRVLADDTTRPMFENQEPGFLMTLKPEAGLMFMNYPCRDQKVLNAGLFHPTRPAETEKGDWNSPATVEDVVSQLGDKFHPFWSALARCADSVSCYLVTKRDPVPRMSKGKAVVIGDAAHAMLPGHAQGAAMSLEDAATLEVFFRDFGEGDSIEERLELFSRLRLPRNATTQLLSNDMMYDGTAEEAVERIRQFYKGPLLAPDAGSWSSAAHDFFYTYDAFKQAEKALKHVNADGGIPDGAVRFFYADDEDSVGAR